MSVREAEMQQALASARSDAAEAKEKAEVAQKEAELARHEAEDRRMQLLVLMETLETLQAGSQGVNARLLC
jgi:hypothetical protein